MKKAVIYCRYSCDKQQETSIEGQLDVCYSYANKNGYEVVQEFIDRATTGRNDNRAEFQRMLSLSNKKEFDAVIVYKLDRFSRNRYEAVINEKKLNDNGVLLLSAMENVNDNAESVILKSLMQGLNEYYSLELSQKVLRTFKIMREDGKWLGGKIPYGYKIIDQKYVIDEEQARNVRALFFGVMNGTPPSRMATQLGIPVSGSYIIHNRKYIGELSHQDTIIKDAIPRIIDDKTFELANAQLSKYEHHAHYKYALSDKMFCGTCGTRFKGESCKNHLGKIYRYYKPKCGCTKRIDCDILESKICTEIKKVLDADTIKRIADKTMELLKEKLKGSTLDRLERDLNANRKKQSNLVDTIAETGANPILSAKLNALAEEERMLENKLATHKDINISNKKIIDYLTEYLNGDDLDHKILTQLVRKVVVYNDYYEITCGNYSAPIEDEERLVCDSLGRTTSVANELFICPNSFKIRIAC